MRLRSCRHGSSFGVHAGVFVAVVHGLKLLAVCVNKGVVGLARAAADMAYSFDHFSLDAFLRDIPNNRYPSNVYTPAIVYISTPRCTTSLPRPSAAPSPTRIAAELRGTLQQFLYLPLFVLVRLFTGVFISSMEHATPLTTENT
ncbi:unnamed protein product, partial [Ectocarpus sp. 12 AP-2014]